VVSRVPRDPRLKILLLNYEYPPLGGGGGKQAMQLSRAYARDHDVYYLTAGFDAFGLSEVDGYRLHRLKTSRQATYRCTNPEMLSYLAAAWRALPGVLESFVPDVVHCFFGIPTGVLAAYPALRRRPWVLSVRGSDVPGHSPDISRIVYGVVTPVVRRVWKAMDAVVCNSDALRDEVLAVSPGLAVDVIPNGIDTSRFFPAPQRPRERPLTVLYAGRLIPLKQVNLLVRALATPALSAAGVRLRVVGDGVEAPALRALASELGVAARVHFVGEVPYADIPGEYRRADLYAQLSVVEGMSNTIVEAMASGLPIITSPAGNARDLVRDNGCVLDAPAVESVAEAITRYVQQPALLAEQGLRSRAAAERLGFEAMAASYVGVIERCRSGAARR